MACHILFGMPAKAYGEKSPALEYQVKAAYLYNFTRFVTWPPSGSDLSGVPIKLCTVGDDPFGDSLDQLSDKTANGRPLEISRLIQIDEIQSCQLLFIGHDAPLHQILPVTEQSNILTVGEDERFSELGGIIRFKMDENVCASRNKFTSVWKSTKRLRTVLD